MARGYSWMQNPSTSKNQQCLARPVLTRRERQIADLVSEGLSNKEIGRRLGLSAGTIRVHLHRTYQKLAINNRTTLAAWSLARPGEIY
jgi:two-component system, NarL family, nitrate/nitrite response regulator NarL